MSIAHVLKDKLLRGPRRVKMVENSKKKKAIYLDFSLEKPYMQSKLMMFYK